MKPFRKVILFYITLLLLPYCEYLNAQVTLGNTVTAAFAHSHPATSVANPSVATSTNGTVSASAGSASMFGFFVSSAQCDVNPAGGAVIWSDGNSEASWEFEKGWYSLNANMLVSASLIHGVKDFSRIESKIFGPEVGLLQIVATYDEGNHWWNIKIVIDGLVLQTFHTPGVDLNFGSEFSFMFESLGEITPMLTYAESQTASNDLIPIPLAVST